ncbi:putative reverse transcriptase domain-containing protein [Tanacetum coccineum]|uniref:Reverse transcriptase domain-containing protein n=1 Tax=Tanacetum coccineum TaxID=301880 RepID=A0ABQ5J0J9_9ASTR
MLRVYVIDFGGSWDVHLPLVEFSYNNSYHSSIRRAPFEALYGRKCRSHVLWAEIGESMLIGSKLVQEMTDNVVLIKEKLKAARDRQKSYAENRRKPLEFEVKDQVLLKVLPWKGVIRFGKKGKLAPRYVGPFEILEKIEPVAYQLRLLEELSSVHDTFHVSNLKKCLADANLHVPLDEIKVDKTLRFVEEPAEIMDREVKSLKRSKIPIVKVRWNSKRGPEFTWECEDHMKAKYPRLFIDRAVEPTRSDEYAYSVLVMGSDSAKDSIATQACKLSKEDFNDFFTLYPIPSEYHIILPKSNQTVFDAPPGYVMLYTYSFSLAKLRLPLTDSFAKFSNIFIFIYLGLTLLVVPSSPLLLSCARLMVVSPLSTLQGPFNEMAFRKFIYTEDDEDLLFLPKEPSQASALTKRCFEIKDKKCKTRGGSSRPPVKRKLALGSSTSCTTHAKTSSSKDDVPYLTVSDDDEVRLSFFNLLYIVFASWVHQYICILSFLGLPDVLELIDTTACHLKTSAITPLTWKNHLDNHMDMELLDLYDRCYARQSVVDKVVNRRSHDLLQVIEKLRGEFDVIKDRERAKEEEYEELRAKYEAAMTEFEKNPTVVASGEEYIISPTKVKEH